MMSRVFNTVRAFFLGFALVSRDSAAGTLNQYRSRIFAGLMLAVYYGVMGYYFLHHAKNAPKEQVSDHMMLLFQVVFALPFYMGFHKLVQYLQREDVQRAFVRNVETAKTYLLFVWGKLLVVAAVLWKCTTATARGITFVSAVTGHVLKRLTLAALRVGKRVVFFSGRMLGAGTIIAIACSLEGLKNARAWSALRIKAMKRFAANCVEVGESARM
jgi:hypothetical protein